MTRRKIARTVLVEGRVYERRGDGSLIPLAYRVDDKRVDSKTAAAVEAVAAHDRDGALMTNDESAKGEIARPTKLPSASGWTTMCSPGSRRAAPASRPASIRFCAATSRRNERRGDGTTRRVALQIL